MALPDAATKLRTVLDYVPCEACLAEPVEQQELLCSVCRRLDRQIGVRIAVRTTVLVERPDAEGPAPPVVIPPPSAPAPIAAPSPVVVFVPAGASPPEPAHALEILVTPIEAAPIAAAPEPDFEDIISFTAPSDVYDYVRPESAGAAPTPPPAAPRPPPPTEPIPEDENVFRPPPAVHDPRDDPEEEARARPMEDWLPGEEAEASAEDALAHEPDVPPPAAQRPSPLEDTDLWKLHEFDEDAHRALADANVNAIADLAGRDAGELAARTQVPTTRLVGWIGVADLVQQASVPLDAALLLVGAGFPGPAALHDADVELVVERVRSFSGVALDAREVKRWKKRS